MVTNFGFRTLGGDKAHRGRRSDRFPKLLDPWGCKADGIPAFAGMSG